MILTKPFHPFLFPFSAPFSSFLFFFVFGPPFIHDRLIASSILHYALHALDPQ